MRCDEGSDQKKVLAPRERRDYINDLKGRYISERRSCNLIGMSRSGYRYRQKKKDDAELISKLREYSKAHPTSGYRFAWVHVRRCGMMVNHKLVHRLWRECGLCQPRRRKRRRAGPRSETPVRAEFRAHVWCYDFMEDRTINGQCLRILTVEDEFTREGLAAEVDFSMPASRVVEVLERLFSEYGAPQYLRSDNGPEFIADVLRRWLEDRGVKTEYIEPGKPWQNGKCERFNGTLRGECLDREVFHSLLDARVKTEEWRRYYSNERPHSSLGYLTPDEFARGARVPELERGRPSSSSFFVCAAQLASLAYCVRRR